MGLRLEMTKARLLAEKKGKYNLGKPRRGRELFGAQETSWPTGEPNNLDLAQRTARVSVLRLERAWDWVRAIMMPRETQTGWAMDWG